MRAGQEKAAPTEGAAHVVFSGVSKSFGAHLAVDALDLDVQRGEFLTLLGPSGSGKTTTLMMLAGFEQPDAGQIHLNGQRIDPIPANRRNLGLVFQNYALFPHMSVAENLAYPLKVRRFGRSQIQDRVRQILDLVQLPGFEARRIDQLSGGQQQRVAVARALIFQPELVLMDEPLGALDKKLREEMQGELKAIHKRLGVTFLYVTHDQSESLTLSDRIAVFSRGRVQQLAPPRELYERPASAFVASFLGENNQLAGRVERLSEGLAELRLDLGPLIPAEAAPGLRAGETAVISVRPERIRLLGPSETAEVEIAARLSELIYGGDHLRLIAEAASAEQPQKVMVKLPIGAPGERLAATLAPGAALRLGWDKAAGRALPIVRS